MTMKCPCCGLTNARKGNNATGDTMFFPLIDCTDDCLVICVACLNVVAGPPGEDGCLFVPSDERLAAELTAIQKTARHIQETKREVTENHKATEPHKGRSEGYRVRNDGGIEFCFKKTRNEKFVVNMVKGTLNKLGFANARYAGGSSALCRQQCPNKKGYEHVAVKIDAVSDSAE